MISKPFFSQEVKSEIFSASRNINDLGLFFSRKIGEREIDIGER